jgi:hypothetical protein
MQIRFRFIAGCRESLFDSPKFQFVADSRAGWDSSTSRIVRKTAYVVGTFVDEDR